MQSTATVQDPELFFAIIAPMGSNTAAAVDALREALQDWHYGLEEIRISDLVKGKSLFGDFRNDLPIDEHYEKGIKACNTAREKLKSKDAMVQMAVSEVQTRRLRRSDDPENDANRSKPRPRFAYVFKSLKLPEEIRTLRRLYGQAFFAIAIHAHRESRRRSLAERIKESHADVTFKDKHFELAERLLTQDEYEGGFGQNIRDAFPEADFFTATDRPEDLKNSISRFVKTIFRHPFVTPSRDELAMSHAKTAAMRSGDLSRQVGAAITNSDGDIIALGCNEVPKAGGGQPFEGDMPDVRDYHLAYDPNDKWKRYVISELLGRMREKWLRPPFNQMSPEKLYEEASSSEEDHAFLEDSRADSLIEFGRIMHAEMAAITDAARRGISLQDTTLYCTTLPCHMCARLIIGSGISRICYIEPQGNRAIARLPLACLLSKESVGLEA